MAVSTEQAKGTTCARQTVVHENRLTGLSQDHALKVKLWEVDQVRSHSCEEI